MTLSYLLGLIMIAIGAVLLGIEFREQLKRGRYRRVAKQMPPSPLSPTKPTA